MYSTREELIKRIRDLEEQARITLDVLDMAGTLGDFQTSINMMQDPVEVLKETAGRIQSFSHFRAVSFYLVDEATSDFVMTTVEPLEHKEFLREEVDILINNGIFAMALRENRPITAYSSDRRNRLVLHALATSSRVRGMFVGFLGRVDTNISAMLLALLSIILKNSANALESYELYQLLRASEERYRALGDVLPATLFELDGSARLRFVNHTITRQFGCDREQFQAEHPIWQLAVEEERERMRDFLKGCIAEARSGSLPFMAVNERGETFPAVAYVAPMLANGGCKGLRGAITDLNGHAQPACWLPDGNFS